MPEGDTIHKLAAALGPELSGQRLTRVQVRRAPHLDLARRQIVEVTSKGKHLYIALDDGRVIRNHLGMYGSWHRYRPGEPWQKPQRQASLVLEIAERVYVCFNAKEVQIMELSGFEARDQRNRLGPDLTREAPTPQEILSRARDLSTPETLVADLLLDQRIASGIGNVYKSEVLFLEGVSPLARLGTLGSDQVAELYAHAGRLLRSNLVGGPRITRDLQDGRGNLWVYRRADLPCLRCGAPIERAMLGRTPRSTYWCPSCQPESAATSDCGQPPR